MIEVQTSTTVDPGGQVDTSSSTAQPHGARDVAADTSVSLAEVTAAADGTAATDGELDALVVEHLPVVHAAVRETSARIPGFVDRADLVSAGLVALVSASRAFDPGRGVPFAAYARLRVRGAIVDELRSIDWATRGVRQFARNVDATQTRLAAALGRVPEPVEVATAMGVPVDAVHRSAAAVAQALVRSLDDERVSVGAAYAPATGLGPEAALLHREQLRYLADAIEELPPRQARVVRGYFLEEIPMRVLADELGVTESRISQIRAEAMVLLRGALDSGFADRDVHDVRGDHGEQLKGAQSAGVQGESAQAGIVARRRETYYAAVAERNAGRMNGAAQVAQIAPAWQPSATTPLG